MKENVHWFILKRKWTIIHSSNIIHSKLYRILQNHMELEQNKMETSYGRINLSLTLKLIEPLNPNPNPNPVY